MVYTQYFSALRVKHFHENLHSTTLRRKYCHSSEMQSDAQNSPSHSNWIRIVIKNIHKIK